MKTVITLVQDDAGQWGYTVLEGGRVVALEQPCYDSARDALGDALACPTALDAGGD